MGITIMDISIIMDTDIITDMPMNMPQATAKG